MNDFRPLAHLEEQLGETRWRVLIDPVNTGKIKDILDGLVAARLPTTMTIGGRTYDILSFLKGDERMVKGDNMVTWVGGRWVKGWHWLDYDWNDGCWVLRRKSA